uniref:Killer cell lectin like receptor G2 n=1 Tax=Microcebus murinus TaxID=30608 RepID=A0A8C5YBF4_MICMU
MERAREAPAGGPAGAELPAEPAESRVPELQQPQVPAEAQQLESPDGSPSLARTARDAAGAGPDAPGEKKPSPPRPGLLRVPPLSLGYGPPSPGPASAEQLRNGEAPGPAPGAWAPVELQVDVRVKPVGAAGGSRAPSPAPSTRFLTVPVPESPGFSRHASPAHPLLQRAPSLSGTWGRGSPLAAAGTDSGRDAEGRASPAEGSAGSPTCRCRCKELGLEREDAVLLHPGDKKLPRAIGLIDSQRMTRTTRISAVEAWRKASLWPWTAAPRDPGSVPRGPSDLGSAHLTPVGDMQHRPHRPPSAGR